MQSPKKRRFNKKRPLFNRRTLKDLTKSSTAIENKLSQLALLLQYEFELGVDFRRRRIKITDEIDSFTFDIVDGAMTEMESQGKGDITIIINSPGGSSYHAMAIRSRIRKSTCKVVTQGYGHVMSAATILLASGTRRREIAEEAFFMWHEASYDPGDGRHSAHKATVAQIDREEKYWAKCMADITNGDVEFWQTEGIGKDAYFSAEELVAMGVADEVF